MYFQLENCPTLFCVVVLKFNVVNFVTYLGRKLNPGMVDSVWFSKFFPERKYLSPIPCQRPFFNITICVAYIWWRLEEEWHSKGYCISILYSYKHQSTRSNIPWGNVSTPHPPTKKSANIIIGCHSLLFLTFTTTYNKWRGRKPEMEFDRQRKNLPRTN